jgi:hypothetical protein
MLFSAGGVKCDAPPPSVFVGGLTYIIPLMHISLRKEEP